MTTKTATRTASTAQPTKARTTAAKKPTQKRAQPAKAAGAARVAQNPQTGAQPTKASTPKVATKADGTKIAVVAVRFYRLRKTGTTRHLPVLDAGSEDRTTAEGTAQRLANGETVQAIAEGTGLSVSTVRRQAATLDFTQRVEAGEFTPLVKKAKDGKVVFPASTKDAK